VEMQYISPPKLAAFMQVTTHADAGAMLAWLRENAKIAAAILTLKSDKRDDKVTFEVIPPPKDDVLIKYQDVQDTEEYRQILEAIDLPPADQVKNTGHALTQRQHDIPIKMTCLSPLSHGGDMKAGNSTLFRRQQVISTTGCLLTLPYIDGNAPRGLLRDFLGIHLLSSLTDHPFKNIQWGIRNPKGLKDTIIRFFQEFSGGKPSKLWLYHALFSGGALEENSSAMKKIHQKLGGNGASNAAGIHEFRNMIPMLSVLGSALGNRIINGSINVCKFEPECAEYGTGDLHEFDLMTWNFITRRDDDEDRPLDEKSHAMIANTECLKAGTVLHGGIDYHLIATDVELSCVGKGLELWRDYGFFGAANRHGLGEIRLEFDAPSGDLYESYIADNKAKILQYFEDIGGINESGKLAL